MKMMKISNTDVNTNQSVFQRIARVTSRCLLASVICLASWPITSPAEQPNDQPTLTELIRQQSVTPAAISGPVQAEQPASSKIEPLPKQSELFGRLGGDSAKLEDDKISFYRQTVQTPTPESFETSDGVYLESDGVYPTNTDQRVTWGYDVYTWAAPSLYHQPLYFEEVNLERYGNGVHKILQSPVSAAHFFTNIAVLPYHVASLPPRNRVYTLGHYRPGDCVPHRFHRAPFSVKGLAAQGAAAAGVILIP